MKSPKFQYLRPRLQDLFNATNSVTLWRRHIRPQLALQAITDLVDYRDFDSRIAEHCRDLENAICSAEYHPKEPKRFLVEKSRGLCRQMTLIHPIDLIVLEVLSKALYPSLKNAAPTQKAYFAPNDGRFQARIAESSYGSFASWKRFQRATLGFSKECKFVVVTDVANFYDFINFRHLRNIISSLHGIREALLDILIFTLQKLCWSPDYMPPPDMGMPQIEASAPRVLANAMLYEVDQLIVDRAVDNYARFMDDIDFGVQSVELAKTLLRDIDLALQARQLRLNSSKTRIMRASEAHDHFCVAENAYLKRFEALSSTPLSKGRRALICSILNTKHAEWWDAQPDGSPNPVGRFRRDNGGKILKWSWSLRRSFGADLEDDDLLWAVKLEPTLRSAAFVHLSFSKRPNIVNEKLLALARRGYFVDDAALIDYTTFLTNTLFKRTAKHGVLVRQACEAFRQNSNVGAVCEFTTLAKLGQPQEILDSAQIHFASLRRDYLAARALAGCFPRFLGTALANDFVRLVARLDSEAATAVLQFHQGILRDSRAASNQFAYLRAPNSSIATGIRLPKALMLLTAKHNSSFAAGYARARAYHKRMSKDAYYVAIGL